jgi:glucose-6-phosphate 1-dehydrogenase
VSTNQPTLVVLGASGDLAARLLFPALLQLEHRERLENLRVIGYARQDWTSEQFHENLRAAIDHSGAGYDAKYFDKFIDRIDFHGGDLSVESLRVLQGVLDGPAIFYLALPPGVFADAAETIAKAGLADESNGSRRLVIEKPFGTDLTSALALDEQLHRGWRENQIFRIDHFLGKETVQNILVFRFANRFIEPVLRSAHVDEIQITVAETLGVENRSRYYDGIGALRDMIQNHLLQIMTFATMEPPALWDAEMIRDHKVEVLKAVRAVNPEVDAVRGQYSAGLVEGEPRLAYRAEPGVDPASRTETFAAVRLYLDTWRWEGVPVLLRSGKRLANKAHEVAFRFKEPPTRLFRHTPLEHADPNWLVFRMSPTECTELVMRTKHPGLDLEARESILRADYSSKDDREASAYEQLLLDVLNGDHTPFLRFDEVEWSWRIVDPILQAWKVGAPEDYVAGSDGPTGEHRFLGPGHSWRPLDTPV